ncbi:MAG: hypothetical protein WC292_04405 [Clostridia bacterium]
MNFEVDLDGNAPKAVQAVRQGAFGCNPVTVRIRPKVAKRCG